MKTLLFFNMFLVVCTGFAQDNSQKEEVKQVIEQFFEGFHKKDTVLMTQVTQTDIPSLTTFTNKDGERILRDGDFKKFLTAIATRKDEEIWLEKLLSFSIQIDGNMANAWVPYEFWYNGSFSHCGVNSFQLFHSPEGWKIIYLIDSRRRAGCESYQTKEE